MEPNVLLSMLHADDELEVAFGDGAAYDLEYRRMRGVEIRVQDTDETLVIGNLAMIAERARKNVPWWSFVRHPIWSFVLLFATPLAGLLLLAQWPIVDRMYGGSPPQDVIQLNAILVIYGILFACIAIAYGLRRITLGRLLPTFELRRNGAGSQTEPALSLALSVALALIGISLSIDN